MQVLADVSTCHSLITPRTPDRLKSWAGNPTTLHRARLECKALQALADFFGGCHKILQGNKTTP